MPAHFIVGEDRSDVVPVYYASSSFFAVLGVTPQVGRLFVSHEDEAMSDAVIVSYEAWQRRFGGRSDIVGSSTGLASTLRSPTELKTVIGVLPPGFAFQGGQPEFFLPMGLMAFNGSFEANQFLRAVGRVAEGVSLDEAGAIAEPIVRGLESPERQTARVLKLTDDQFGMLIPRLWLLLSAAGLLLVVACSSVGGLVLVDAGERNNEMKLRAALGARRRDLLKQLAAEYALIAVVASALGLAIARLLRPVLLALAPIAIRSADSIGIDYQVACWSLLCGSGTVLLFAAIPAIRLSAVPTGIAGPQVTSSTFGHRTLVATQIAVTFLLVVCAGLFGRALVRLQESPLGFDPSGVAVAAIKRTRLAQAPLAPSATGRPSSHAVHPAELLLNTGWLTTKATLTWLGGLPGVVEMGGTNAIPLLASAPTTAVRESGVASEEFIANRYDVTEGYFRAMGIPVVSGRTFLPSDRDVGTPFWAVVSNGLAKRLSGGVAVGKRLSWAGYPLEIIGVVQDVRHRSLDDNQAALYLLDFRAEQTSYYVLRTTADAGALLSSIRRVLQDRDPTIRVSLTSTMKDIVQGSTVDARFQGFVAALFATVALVVAAVGLFGLISYLLSRRARELALRMALGAEPADVRLLVLADAGTVVLGGLVVGIPAAYALSASIGSLLFGLVPAPLVTLALAIAVLALVSFCAVIAPLMQAVRLDLAARLRG